ncbi:divergent polysaccharide deacetylase family protein [Maridesulfovibrio sp. FT414]|uniref:divergent polysaccharide deacetylase family protein n=1 Tax=Maridesulfovibrio sp. FT414 TaxID=2979469 RepID=UPI003D806CFE
MENQTHDQNTEPEIPEQNPGLRARLFKPAVIAAATIAAAACICLVIALLFSPAEDTSASGKKPAPSEQALAEQNSTETAQPILYEEPQENDMDDLVKQVDLALITALKKADISMSELRLEDVSIKKHQGRDFHFQQLSFPCKGDKQEFVASIRKGLEDSSLNASIHETSPESWLISVNGVPTHRFSLFTPVTTPIPAPTKPDPNAPKMAIVIDDMGEDLTLAKGLAALDVHVSFSIWPNSSQVQKTIDIARKHGNEIMIHLPMQPKGYPKVNPGPDALLVGMSEAQIRDKVLAAVSKVPGARGLNNHMGSKFTEDLNGMNTVMSQLKKEKIYFLDSRTTPDSAAPKAAKSAGVKIYERSIFLDNVKNVAAIKFQLSKTAELARKRGQAIAIGHPHRETLKAIRQWAAENKGKVNIVPVEKLKPVS